LLRAKEELKKVRLQSNQRQFELKKVRLRNKELYTLLAAARS